MIIINKFVFIMPEYKKNMPFSLIPFLDILYVFFSHCWERGIPLFSWSFFYYHYFSVQPTTLKFSAEFPAEFATIKVLT